jgi:hypothetical protein
MSDQLRQRLINAMPVLRHSACSTVLDDILAELDAAGYVIVPRDATREMRDEGDLEMDNHAWSSAVYSAMLAAAPVL